MHGISMKRPEHHLDIKKLSFAGLIITLGVVYGDLGTLIQQTLSRKRCLLLLINLLKQG